MITRSGHVRCELETNIVEDGDGLRRYRHLLLAFVIAIFNGPFFIFSSELDAHFLAGHPPGLKPPTKIL